MGVENDSLGTASPEKVGERRDDRSHGLTAPAPEGGAAAVASSTRAWFYLVWLSIQRQARLRQMVGIALALLAVCVAAVAINSKLGRFGTHHWRTPRGAPLNYEQWMSGLEMRLGAAPQSPAAHAVQQAVLGAWRAHLEQSDFYGFSVAFVLSVFVTFLLPVWSLSFATNALGSEREGGNLVWLLTRPLSRPAIYLAKFVAQLPWSLALNVGGFALVCLAAGRPGPQAFLLYWPAVFCGTLAFCALFHLMGAYFQRPAITAVVYSFFLEMILGTMPGYMKRVSIGFYVRSMMYDAGQDYGVQPRNPAVELPVDGVSAMWVLAATTVLLLLLGMVVFTRKEYQDLA